VQDPHVLLRRPPGLFRQQRVVGQAEAAGGEHLGLVAVVGERPRLAHQPVDHVPVVDAVPAVAAQPGQILHLPLRVVDLDPLGEEAALHPLADQPGGHGVAVALHVDRAAPVHPHVPALAPLQTRRRQRPQPWQLLVEALLPALVELAEQAAQEAVVLRAAVEVAAAAQHEGLVQGALEAVVALLAVAVLVGLPHVDGLAGQPVVAQQRLVALGELVAAARRDGGAEAVGAVQLRHAAEPPEGVLEPLGEALVTLGEADGAGLPVGVGQHEVVDQVVEGPAAEGHAQLGAVGEVAGAQPAGVMHLVEVHLAGGAFQGTPLLDAALQGAQLTVGEAPGEAALQVGEQGLGLQPGVEPEAPLQFVPDLGEGIGTGTPGTGHEGHLAGKLAEAAVLARRLGVEAGLGGGHVCGKSLGVVLEEAASLLVGDHPEPPFVVVPDSLPRRGPRREV
jgi:hypothetical protein